MKSLTLGIASLFVGIATVSGAAPSGGDDRADSRFVGAWHLVWLEQPGPDGKLHRINCCGLLVYTADGHMSVKVMERNPPAQTSAAPQQYSQGGYEASYGRYDVNERAHTFTFHVEGAWCGPLLGKTCRAHTSFRANSSS